MTSCIASRWQSTMPWSAYAYCERCMRQWVVSSSANTVNLGVLCQCGGVIRWTGQHRLAGDR